MEIVWEKEAERKLAQYKRKHYPVQDIGPCLEAIIKKDNKVLRRIKDHALTGDWSGYRCFHPGRFNSKRKTMDDWIVVYIIDHNKLIVTVATTGPHKILKQKKKRFFKRNKSRK